MRKAFANFQKISQQAPDQCPIPSSLYTGVSVTSLTVFLCWSCWEWGRPRREPEQVLGQNSASFTEAGVPGF